MIELKPASLVNRWQPSELIVGNQEIHELMDIQFKKHECLLKVEVEPLVSKNVLDLAFGRDYRVVRIDGSHLIPYNYKMHRALLEGRFRAMCPLSLNHLCKGDFVAYGTGFFKKYTDYAIAYAAAYDIPFTQGRSVIEGGNCHLFVDQGVSKGIVGVASVILTMIALEEQQYFEIPEIQQRLNSYKSQITAPSDDYLRMARNLNIYDQLAPDKTGGISKNISSDRWDLVQNIAKLYKKNLKDVEEKIFLQWSTFRMDIAAPLRKADRSEYKIQVRAIELEAKRRLTEELIAQELGLLLENLSIIPQSYFHIDLNICIEPSTNLIYFHDELLAIDVCSNSQDKQLNEYQSAATKRKIIQSKINDEMKKILQTIGYKIAPLPGVYLADGNKSINFMNGCFVQCKDSMTFFTNGSRDHPELENAFEYEMKKYQPSIKVCFLESSSLESIVTEFFGGLHCLTWPK
jgi:hypothetical protein